MCNFRSSRSIRTSPLQARETIKVPGMGDSITEGTIVEWCVSPGSLVKEGDVVALVETDKVTVDIKADKTGVLVEQLGEVEGVVEVGGGLYVLDTDTSLATAGSGPAVEGGSGDAAAAGEGKTEESNVSEAGSMEATPSPKSSKRTPSIHFLGKEGWKQRLSATDSSSSTSAQTATSTSTSTTTTTVTNAKPHSPSTVTQIPYSAMYGRPPITDEEMDALVLGGAEEAPEVKTVVSKDGVSGVVFSGGKIVTAGPRGVWLAEETGV
eukprot:CAMPEP_0171374386 /NCGR_PEP_ID=MMETSP0879-20121228/14665_1 /TAXON_ID=67004 /ORGANISM="Thalassiosira weissflogii, Strain CCMP1336" /LENGTH=265 /DNA_ID=CAMNT_0011883729 /DNA_START=355 /DNA_END=1152 /DNA_ORIENTATION=-